MARFTVILDACVLYPAPLRDLLLQLAIGGLYRARWTERIEAEWVMALRRNRPDLEQAALERTCGLMRAAVPDCLVEGYTHLVGGIALPDDDDRHVAAAAVQGRADAIVTFNLRDFPAGALDAMGVEAIHPDDFLRAQFDLDEAAVVNAARACRLRLTRPPVSAPDYLDALARQPLPKTVVALRPFVDVI